MNEGPDLSLLMILTLKQISSYSMIIEPWRPFEPTFVVQKKSSYRNAWSFLFTTQKSVFALDHDSDATQPDNCVGLMPDNPLYLDVSFGGIQMMFNSKC